MPDAEPYPARQSEIIPNRTTPRPPSRLALPPLSAHQNCPIGVNRVAGVALLVCIRHDDDMTITEGVRDLPERVGYLPSNSCKARYGVGYVRTICSQAGVGFDETSPDEDYLAVDATVKLPFASASIQIKCTTQFRIAGRSVSWPAKVEWRESWRQSLLPVYFVLVTLDLEDRISWIVHKGDGTFHRAAAYWTRVDRDADLNRISIPKNQRLTVDTMDGWSADVLACFQPREAVS